MAKFLVAARFSYNTIFRVLNPSKAEKFISFSLNHFLDTSTAKAIVATY
jgi:hypothetical protein